MKENPEIPFSPEAEEKAITLAAFNIMKQFCEEGKITKEELQYLAEKYGISVEKD